MLNLQEILDFIKPLFGQICWDIGRSYGSMILLDFGDKVGYNSPKHGLTYKGSWVLMVEQASWKLFKQNELLVDSNSSLDDIDNKLTCIQNNIVDKIIIDVESASTKHALFYFNQNYRLEVLSCDGDDCWSLFSPFGKTLSCNSGNLSISSPAH